MSWGRSRWLKVAGVVVLFGAALVVPFVVWRSGSDIGFFEMNGDSGPSPFLYLVLLLVAVSLLGLFEWRQPVWGGAIVGLLGLGVGVLLWRVFTVWGTFDGDGDVEAAVLLAIGVVPFVSGSLCFAAGVAERKQLDAARGVADPEEQHNPPGKDAPGGEREGSADPPDIDYGVPPPDTGDRSS